MVCKYKMSSYVQAEGQEEHVQMIEIIGQWTYYLNMLSYSIKASSLFL